METRRGDTDADIAAEAEAEIQTGDDSVTAITSETGIGVAIGHQEEDMRHIALAQQTTETIGAAITSREITVAKERHAGSKDRTEGTEIEAVV